MRGLQKMMPACVMFCQAASREKEDAAREALQRMMSRPLAPNHRSVNRLGNRAALLP
jgi:hypothetical protein